MKSKADEILSRLSFSWKVFLGLGVIVSYLYQQFSNVYPPDQISYVAVTCVYIIANTIGMLFFWLACRYRRKFLLLQGERVCLSSKKVSERAPKR